MTDVMRVNCRGRVYGTWPGPSLPADAGCMRLLGFDSLAGLSSTLPEAVLISAFDVYSEGAVAGNLQRWMGELGTSFYCCSDR